MNVSPPTLTSSSPGSLQFRMYDAVLYVSINDHEWKAIFSVPKGNTSFQMDESVPQDWSAKSTKYDRRKPAERVKADFYKVWHEYLAQQFVWAAYRHTYPPDYANAAKPWPDPEDFEIDWPSGRSVEGAAYKPWEGGARAYPEVDHFSDCADGFKRKRNDFIFICRNPDGYPCDECGKPIEDRSNRCKWRVSDKTFKAMHYNCSWGFLQNLRPTIGGDFGVRAATNGEQTAGRRHGSRDDVDYWHCPECGSNLQWEPQPGEAGVYGFEHALCSWCQATWTEEELEAVHDADQRTWLRAEALGEKKAPPEVNTLRDEACPVCGETEAYNGNDCAVCGFIKPPDAFLDPNVEKAKEVNLRQDQQEAGQAPAAAPATLQCDNCGATFGAAGEATAPGTTNPVAPSAGGGLERFKVASVSKGGTPSPELTIAWQKRDGWRPEDGPRDTDYSDDYWIAELTGPEPIDRIEGWVHDHTAFGRPQFSWEVDGSPSWSDTMELHAAGNASTEVEAKQAAERAIRDAFEKWWADYDDTPTPKGPRGGFPWDHRASRSTYQTDHDCTFGPDCKVCRENRNKAMDKSRCPYPGCQHGAKYPHTHQHQAKAAQCPNCYGDKDHPRFRIGRGFCHDPFHSKAKQGALPAPTKDGDPVDEDPTAIAPKAGDACPECGEGTLHPVEAAPSPGEGAPTPPQQAPAEPGEVSSEQAPADGEGDPKAEKPEESKPEGEQPDDEDDEDDDANPKAPKDTSKGQKESKTMRPTLRRLAEQQVMIETLGEGIDAIATAAGLDLTPLKQRAASRLTALAKGAADIPDGPVVQEDAQVFAVVAATRKVADEQNPANPIPEPAAQAPAVTTEEAKTPAATTDVTSPAIGSEVLTEGVTPAATTSLQDGGTVLDQPLDLNEQTVTAPVAGTQTNDGAHKVEHDISSGVDNPPANGPAFPLQGPFAEQAKVTGAISEGRTFASLRLARLRIQAGIVPPQDDLVLAQTLAKDAALTDEAIAAETATLSQVIAAQPQAQPVRPVARRLVPQAAAATAQPIQERAVPSLVTAAAASPVGGPSSQAVTSDEVDALW